LLIKHLRNRLLRCRKKLSGSESVQDLFPFWIYSYCRWTSTYQQWRVDIPLTSFTQSHCCSFQIQYLDFQHQMSYYFCIQWLFVVYLLTITVWFIFIMILFNQCIYHFSSSLFFILPVTNGGFWASVWCSVVYRLEIEIIQLYSWRDQVYNRHVDNTTGQWWDYDKII